MSDTKYHQAMSANRKLVAEIARLTAQNKRLRKAGDAMADDLECLSENDLCFNSLDDWNAAKEGGDAK